MKNFPIYILALLTVLYSCTKTKEEKSPDGKLLKRYEYYEDENGSIIKHGDYQSWYQNEIIEFSGEYKENKRHGHWKKWNEKNIQILDCNYKDGLLNGEYKLFDDEGNLNIISFYKDDSLNGLKTEYNEDGSIQQETEFLNGLKDGKVTSYYDGKKSFESWFKKGIPVGKWKAFSTEDNLPYELNFINGCPKELKGKWKVDYQRNTHMEFLDNGEFIYTHPIYKYKSKYDPMKTFELTYEFSDRVLKLKEKNGDIFMFFIIIEVNKNNIKIHDFSNEIILTKD